MAVEMESDLLHSRRVTQRPLLEGMALLLCMAMLTSATTSAHSQCFRGLLAVISVEVCCSQQEQPATHRSRLIGNTTLRAAVHMQELQAAQAYTAAVHSKMGQATHTASRLQSSTKLVAAAPQAAPQPAGAEQRHPSLRSSTTLEDGVAATAAPVATKQGAPAQRTGPQQCVQRSPQAVHDCATSSAGAGVSCGLCSRCAIATAASTPARAGPLVTTATAGGPASHDAIAANAPCAAASELSVTSAATSARSATAASSLAALHASSQCKRVAVTTVSRALQRWNELSVISAAGSDACSVASCHVTGHVASEAASTAVSASCISASGYSTAQLSWRWQAVAQPTGTVGAKQRAGPSTCCCATCPSTTSQWHAWRAWRSACTTTSEGSAACATKQSYAAAQHCVRAAFTSGAPRASRSLARTRSAAGCAEPSASCSTYTRCTRGGATRTIVCSARYATRRAGATWHAKRFASTAERCRPCRVHRRCLFKCQYE